MINKNDINKKITNWFSNPINLRLLILLTYSVVLYTMYNNLTMHEFIFTFIVLLVFALLVRIQGIARGIFIATIERQFLEEVTRNLFKKNNKKGKK